MDKSYRPEAIEQRIYERWEANGYFAPQGDGPRYCIVIPPPNVTGSLHMGHGFDATIQDVLTRYHRMLGHRTLWQPGMDHAGIATQMVVERQLEADNVTRHDLGREKFLDKVWEWKGQYGGTIVNQLKRLGASADWSRNAFTMAGAPGDPKTGQQAGIHWHMNIGTTVEYIARDERRQDIGWVRITDHTNISINTRWGKGLDNPVLAMI